MPAANHPDYREELARCSETLEYAEKSLDMSIKKKAGIDVEVDRIKKHFNSDNSQNYIDLMVNSTLQDSLALKIRNLYAARSKPYFARIDFKEKGKNAIEKLYIGKMSLSRDEDLELIIIDWRAPVSNLYYEGRLGKASYICPEGEIDGELSLKRQFTINSGKLEEIFDIDVTATDELLQSCLGANADNRLKDIVSTIQAEQNSIIRADMWTPLIVQGAAGSGKTTIALHRIAYLIYTYDKTFKPENFMIIAPNKLFLNYISEVLPELGVERVKQTTFDDFAMELVGKRFKVKNAFDKLITFVNSAESQEQLEYKRLLKVASQLKSSIIFKQMIDCYIGMIEQTFISKEDFKIGSVVIFKYDEINSLFLKDYGNLPMAGRLKEIKKHLTNRLMNKKEHIKNQLYDNCDRRIMLLKQSMEETEERQKLIVRAIDKRDSNIENLEKHSKKAVNEYIKRMPVIPAFEYYKDFINSEDMFKKASEGKADTETLDFLRKYSAEILKSGYVEIEDLAPVIYIKYRVYGMDEKLAVRHIVIDEAQDFSVFQLYVMSRIVKDSSFTILGDICQGIHSYRGICDWDEVVRHVFDGRKSRYLTLEQSYRTTVEITQAANSVLKGMEGLRDFEAKPVIRHGRKVALSKKESLTDIVEDICFQIKKHLEEGFSSTAVICKTTAECSTVSKMLEKRGLKPFLITGKEDEYRSGLVVVTSYLAKGLEFDAVMIADAGDHVYGLNELDAKLLYVAMTRPLHSLHIYYSGEPSPLIRAIEQ